MRYPNFTSDQMVSVFLSIFNRLAGQADEMGSFVQALANVSTATQAELTKAHDEKERSLEAIDALVAELEQKTEQHEQSQGAVLKLKEELLRMRSAADVSDIRTGVLSGTWRDYIRQNSQMETGFARSDVLAQARTVLGLYAETPKYQQTLDSLNKMMGASSIFTNPALIQNAAHALTSLSDSAVMKSAALASKSPRKKK